MKYVQTNRRTFLARCAMGAAGAWLAGPRLLAAGHGASAKLDNLFFPYAFEFTKEKLENPPKALKELGYDGAALTWGRQDFAKTLESYRAEGLKVFAVFVVNSVEKSGSPEPWFQNIVKELAGTDVALWCAIAGGTFDKVADKAVNFVREAADIAAGSGVRLVLYPHGSYCPAIASEAVELIRRAERPDVRVTLNLVHDFSRLAAKGPEIIAEVLPYLHIATINGTAGISPLGTGDFDVFGFLKQLKTAGYDGPIGLQTYNIQGPPREHLAQSIKTWREYQARFAAEQKKK